MLTKLKRLFSSGSPQPAARQRRNAAKRSRPLEDAREEDIDNFIEAVYRADAKGTLLGYSVTAACWKPCAGRWNSLFIVACGCSGKRAGSPLAGAFVGPTPWGRAAARHGTRLSTR
ncbi:hypothetical protein HORIV_58030 [Vreelandella olivaria]|uniref:Uncharacterized protein n=1 Tax=Vreelandella olivaria TaxID=390919 RepID=A0ABM7GRM9_9GAMM|nr:hypothetical protein HORIV_58030 [Halomonas olivaria]